MADGTSLDPTDPLDRIVDDITASARGWVDALRAVHALAASCTDEQWTMPSDLPGWSVADVVAHVSGLESANLGWPQPEHELPEGLTHLRNDVGRFMEVAVDVRRSWSRAAVVDELARVVAAREAQVAAGLPASDERIPGLMGRPMPAAVVLSIRAFDVWAHEQDLRRVLGKPGGQDTDGAMAALARIVSALPQVAKQAGLADGQTVLLEVGAPIGRPLALRGGPEGPRRVAPASVTSPDVRIGCSGEAFHLRACGRAPVAALGFTVEGDPALGAAFLEALAFAP